MGKFAYRAYLDGLRGISVVAVVLFHIGTPQFREGFLGVDVFFILSGYLITSIILTEIESTGIIDILRFYARRARRILPGAIVTLLVVSIIERFIDIILLNEHGKCILSASTYWSNFCFINVGTDYWQEGKAVSPVKHYWSLSIEEQFYLFYPFGLLVILSITKIICPRKEINDSTFVTEEQIEDDDEISKELDEKNESDNNINNETTTTNNPIRMDLFLITSIVMLLLCTISSYVYCVYLANFKSQTESHMNSFGRIYQLFSGGILSIILFHFSLSSSFFSSFKRFSNNFNYVNRYFLNNLKFMRILSFLCLFSLIFVLYYPLIYEGFGIHSAYSGMIVVVIVVSLIFTIETELRVRAETRNETSHIEFIPLSSSTTTATTPSSHQIQEDGEVVLNQQIPNNNVVVVSTSTASISVRFLRNTIFVYLGKWSYSIYLWHYPLIVFLDMLNLLPGVDGMSLMRRMTYIIIGSVILGIFSYYVIERTFMRIKIDSPMKKIFMTSMGLIIPLITFLFLYFFVIPKLNTINIDELSADDVIIDFSNQNHNGTSNNMTEKGFVLQENSDDEYIIYGSKIYVYGDSTCVNTLTMWDGLSEKLGFTVESYCHNSLPAIARTGVYLQTPDLNRKFNSVKGNAYLHNEADLVFIYNNVLERECFKNSIFEHYKKGARQICPSLTHDGYREFLERGMKGFIRAILRVDEEIPIVWIPPNPRSAKLMGYLDYKKFDEGDRPFDEDPTTCLQRLETQGIKEYEEGICDRKLYHPYFYYDVVDAAKNVSKARGNMKVLDLDQWYCPDGICPAKVGEYIAWRDHIHVTPDFCVARANEFLNILNENGIHLITPEEMEERKILLSQQQQEEEV